MTPLPAALGGAGLVAWRLDRAAYARTWDSGEGARRFGGRWSRRGVRAVYCALDPATAILEVAVHNGFRVLDTAPHVLTSIEITTGRGDIRVVQPGEAPNPNWLRPGVPSAGQQVFGDTLLAAHRFVIIPSVVSTQSWNLVFVSERAAGAYAMRSQDPFALDTRLHPPEEERR